MGQRNGGKEMEIGQNGQNGWDCWKKEGVALQGYIRLIQVQMKMKEDGPHHKKPVSARPEGDSLDMPLKKLTDGGHRLFERAAIRKVDVPVHFSSATPIEFS
jgi:hypothetical protein